jgi:aerobic C4-dicarboxylate transport protein
MRLCKEMFFTQPHAFLKEMSIRKIITNLTTWVLLSIIAGALMGHFSPETGIRMEPLGKNFINVVKLFIYPLIFLTITLGISGMGDLKKVGKVGLKALIYFEVVTTFALLIGLFTSMVLQPGAGIIPAGGGNVAPILKGAEEFTWHQFLLRNSTLQVLAVSILLGALLSNFAGKEAITRILERISGYVFKALHVVMLFAPVGAFGGMAYTIGKFGLKTLVPLAKLMTTVYATMFFFIFGVLWAILRFYKISLRRLLNYIKEEILIVLGTSSSEAALPALMEKLEKMGCSKPVVGLVVPAGYSFNLDGTTIYLSMAVLFLSQAYGVSLSTSEMLTVMGVLMITSKGAAGVTGSGFVVLASTLSVIKVIPVEGLALLIGVDRFMSEARAITNLIGNAVATVFIANHEKNFDRAKMEEAFSKEVYEYEAL